MTETQSLEWSLDKSALASYVVRQLNGLFPDARAVETAGVESYLDETMRRVEVCFRGIRKKYYFGEARPRFNHLHGDHYAMFLYLLGNSIYQAGGPEELAAKTFLLNKALHGLDVFYGIHLPETFLFVHPVGTVLGNATYGNYLAVYQNCSVGANEAGEYPVLGEGTLLYSKSSLIGACRLGDNVVLGAGAFVLNSDVPANSVVVGAYPNHRLLRNNKSVVDRIFK